MRHCLTQTEKRKKIKKLRVDEDKDEEKKSPLPSENYGSDMRMNSLNMTLKPAFDNFSQHRA